MSACNHRKASSLISTQNLLMSGTPVSIIKHVRRSIEKKLPLFLGHHLASCCLQYRKLGRPGNVHHV